MFTEAHILLGLDKPRSHIVRLIRSAAFFIVVWFGLGWTQAQTIAGGAFYGFLAFVITYLVALACGLARAPYLMDAELREKAGVDVDKAEIVKMLEAAYREAHSLLKRRKELPPQAWRRDIMNWCQETEHLLNEHVPIREALMFRTMHEIPNVNTKFDDCERILRDRVSLLQRIMAQFAE